MTKPSNDQEHSIRRREFSELAAAALSGAIVGLSGCGGTSDKSVAAKNTGSKGATGDLHGCRGLNDCKGKGKSGKNECRGLGECATFQAHECGGHNDCKGQGGCGAEPGLNECAGKGGCSIPMMDGAWKTVRARLETEWKAKSLTFGEAPKKS